MKPKKIIFDNEAREKIAQGADKLARAVVATFGPRSNNVAISGSSHPTHVIHDGVTVARSVKLADPFEDAGVDLLREAATKTVSLVGDGTTTATLLANTLFQEGLKLIKGQHTEGTLIKTQVNPMELREQLLEHSKTIVGELDKIKRNVTSDDEILSVATISAQSPELGKLVADAISATGKTGMVMIERSDSSVDSIEKQSGYEWDKGFLSPGFVTDGNRMIASYEDAYILITDYVIANPDDLTPIVTKVFENSGTRKPLLIISDDIRGSALQSMLITRLKLGYELIAVAAPEYAERRKMLLDDLALLTGATYVREDLGMKLTDLEISDLGRVRNLFVTQYSTSLTPANPDEEEIQERITSIQDQINAEPNTWKKERLNERLAKFNQKVAVIKIGGGSEAEIKEKKDRVEDAVYATKAAIAEGIVPGGGVALYQVSTRIFKEPLAAVELLVQTMLTAPFDTIIKNAGISDELIDWTAVEEGKGFDVITKKHVDMFEAGIIDPVKVTRLAVEHAISTAAMMLTTSVLIADDKEEEKNK